MAKVLNQGLLKELLGADELFCRPLSESDDEIQSKVTGYSLFCETVRDLAEQLLIGDESERKWVTHTGEKVEIKFNETGVPNCMQINRKCAQFWYKLSNGKRQEWNAGAVLVNNHQENYNSDAVLKELSGTDTVYSRNMNEVQIQLEKAHRVANDHIKDIESKSTKEEQIKTMAAYVKIYRDAIENCQENIEKFKDVLEPLVDYRHKHNLYVTKK